MAFGFMSILSIFGLLFILLAGKFIWDTFIIGTIASNHQTNKPLSLEEMAQPEPITNTDNYRNINSLAKTNPTHQAFSLQVLAAQLECEPPYAKEVYQIGLGKDIKSLNTDQQVVDILTQTVTTLRNGSRIQSAELSMNAVDTPAAIMASWANEVLVFVKDAIHRSKEAQYNAPAGVTSPKFGRVTVSEIRPLKEATPATTLGMVVVYTQAYEYAFPITSFGTASICISICPDNSVRKFSEFWTVEEIAAANGGVGLAIGDQVSEVCISSLSSSQPFFEEQQPFSKTGLYYNFVIEASTDNQPNDRRAT